MRNSLLWYDEPAADWNAALPIGNGKLGAMVFGGTMKERLQLNEDSVWSGGFTDRNNPDCLQSRAKVRELLNSGDVHGAQRLATEALTGIPDSQRCYQTLGDMTIELTGVQGDVADYRRELNLEHALCMTRFTLGDAEITREVFASEPDNAIIMQLKSSAKGTLCFRVKLARDRAMDASWTEENNRIGYSGTNGGENGLRFACMAQCIAVGGTMRTIGEYIVVDHAHEATILLTAATSYRYENPIAACQDALHAAAKKPYTTLLARHLAEYQAYFDRSSLTLGQSDAEDLPTDQRLERYHQSTDDQGLIALLYHYGRYLLISSSRPNCLPANLQGIWCQDMKPRWDSKYTININTEMNYWLAESANLSELHQPLFDMMERMYPNGKRTAEVMYGAQGWMAHHNTDLWADTAPQDTYMASTFWVMGAAWLCTHLMLHYEYTNDTAFLQKYEYLIADACRFLLDVQVVDAQGRYIISPTVSPENTYVHPSGQSTPICDGCFFDAQLTYHLFTDYLKVCKILGSQDELALKVHTRLALLPQPEIGADGRLLEWLHPYEEVEKGHRHVSHLYGLFPGTQLWDKHDDTLMTAARKTLEYRLANGGGHTGWSRSWIIGFWAALGDSEKVQENVDALLTNSTLPNLLDNHPPFQIDGNFGAPACILYSLLRSTADTITLLPALPTAWQEGELLGVRARGGLTIDLCWKDGKVQTLTLRADRPYRGTLCAEDSTRQLVLAANETLTISF